MRKTTIMIAAAAVAFDLGVVVATSHAAPADIKIKFKDPQAQAKAVDFFLKFDGKKLTAKSCMEHNGMVTTQGGVQGCKFQNQADANSAMAEVSLSR